MNFKLGLDTFGDITTDLKTGEPVPAHQTLRDIVEEAKLADELGVDAFGIGEHHREDYAVSSPETVLAGIATVTKNISLGTAVTVLSSDDPVRVYERFATLDALSNGRAEIMAGRGSFIESFPLFGYNLKDYDLLYEEKLDLLSKIVNEKPVTWQGETRTALKNQHVYPKTSRGTIPLWVAVGGTPSSVQRAAMYGLPVAYAIIGGPASRFKPLTQLYTQTLQENNGYENPTAVHSMGHIAETDEQAQNEYYPYYEKFYNTLGAERGWGTLTPTQYLHEIKEGALYVGSPETVANKIIETQKTLNNTRFDLKYATGSMPHSLLMESIEFYGTIVKDKVQGTLS